MRVALISLDQRWQDREGNLQRCERILTQACDHRPTVAILPEMTLTGFSMNPAAVMEETDDSPSLRGFATLAKRVGYDLLFGACLRDGRTGRPRNVLCHATPEGVSHAVYAKVHPFSYAGEDLVFEAGDALGYAMIGNSRIGASICYDLRFPALYSAMASECEAVVCIANWPESRISHWQVLLEARAIENQMYMIGVNRIGTDGNGLRYAPSTMVVAPDGSRVAPHLAEEELHIYEIDLTATRHYRQAFPTLRDRRSDLYPGIISDVVEHVD